MKNNKFKLFATAICYILFAQQLCVAQIDSTMYGLSRNSTGVKLARINPTTGIVTDISTSYVSAGFSLSGSCLNPYNNTFTYFGGTVVNTLDITTGSSIASPSITMPSTAQYFQFPFFNNSDSTIYGLARGNIYDSTTMTNIGSMYLATIDPISGIVNQISSSSIGSGILMNTGYTVDPYMKIYYYADNPNSIKGIDMYTGSIYSNTTISRQVSNIVYNCNDNTMYGLVNSNFFDTILDPDTLLPPIILLDSSALQLARIDMTTGNVTVLSAESVGTAYSFNAGITIDPINNLYYYQGPGRLIGISLTTGDIVNNQIINNTTGAPYFDLMRHYQNCYYAESRRANTTSIQSLNNNLSMVIAPNPANDNITLITDHIDQIHSIQLLDMMGKSIASKSDLTSNTIDISNLATGPYILVVYTKTGAIERMKFIKE